MAREPQEQPVSDLDRIREILLGPRVNQLQSRLSAMDDTLSRTEQDLASLTATLQSLVVRVEQQEHLRASLGRLLGEATRLLAADAAEKPRMADVARTVDR